MNFKALLSKTDGCVTSTALLEASLALYSAVGYLTFNDDVASELLPGYSKYLPHGVLMTMFESLDYFLA